MWRNLPRIPPLYTNYNVALHCFLLGCVLPLQWQTISRGFVCCCFCGMLTRNDGDIYSFQTIIAKDRRWCHWLWISIKDCGDTWMLWPHLNCTLPFCYFMLGEIDYDWYDYVKRGKFGRNSTIWTKWKVLCECAVTSLYIFFIIVRCLNSSLFPYCFFELFAFWFKDIMSTW